MFQPIEEPVEVIGVFSQQGFLPKKFRWKKRIFAVDEITLSASVKDGGVKKKYFSVLSEKNLYRLCYWLDDQRWELSEIWFEG